MRLKDVLKTLSVNLSWEASARARESCLRAIPGLRGAIGIDYGGF
jgi:hypothetical protein